MLRAILWDNDGVLVDTEALYYYATRTVLRQVGVEVSEAQFVELSLRRGRSVFDLVPAPARRDGNIERLREQRNQLYGELLDGGVTVLDGVEEVLAGLHGRLTMAIVTSSNRDHFERMHRATGLLRYFDFWLANDAYPRTKPHPDGYLTAMQHGRLQPAECLVVEDSERGLAAARAAGLRCVVIPSGLTRNGRFDGAYRVLDSARDLPALVAALA